MKALLKLLKYAPLFLYILWGVAGTVAAFNGHVFAGLSFLWIPASFIFFILLTISVFWVVGDGIKRRAPKSCENCVFAQQKKSTGKCLGEELGNTYGSVCRCYSRYSYNKPGTEMHKNSGIGYGPGSEPEED